MRRGLVLAAFGVALAGALSTTAAGQERPVASVGHAGVEVPTTTILTAPALVPAPTTTTTAAPRPRTTRATTIVRTDPGGVNVVSEGSASVNTGGNVVIGPPDAAVTNGPATAGGNVSRR